MTTIQPPEPLTGAVLVPSPAPSAALAPASYPRDAHPAALYLAHQQGLGRKSMRSTVERLARLLPGDFTVETAPWHLLRYQHTQAIWQRLHDSGMKPATVKKYLSALRGVLRECRRLGYMTFNDNAAATELPKVRGESLPAGRSLSQTEVTALLTTCAQDRSIAGVRDLALLHAVSFTGMRLTEIMNLTVDAATDVVKILGKGNVEREGFLPADSVAAVTAWMKLRGTTKGPLFLHINKGGKVVPHKLTETSLRGILKRRGAHAGMALFTPHDLRRTFATQSLDTGTDLAVVQRLMGHKSVRTTERYDRRGAPAARAAVDRLAKAYGVGTTTMQMTAVEIFAAHAMAAPDDVHRGRGAHLLQGIIDGGYISYALAHLVEEPFTEEFLKRFSGGPAHKALCAMGARYIEARGLLWSARRNQCMYEASAKTTGIADVMSTDHTIAVECGLTEPTKIACACTQSGVAVLYIPFHWRRLGFTAPTGFSFARTDKPGDDALAAHIATCQRSEDAHRALITLRQKTKRGTLDAAEREALIDRMYQSNEAVICDALGVSALPYGERQEERDRLQAALVERNQ
jgi:site-specific recombinase XerD